MKRGQPSGSSIPMPTGSSPSRCGLRARHRQELAAEERRDLARDAVDGEQVGAVAGRLEVEHLVDERQHIGERRPGLERVVEDDDPAVVGAEVELVLGEDHPLGHLRRAACAARASARSGSVAPGSATATFAPAPKFQAPQTI